MQSNPTRSRTRRSSPAFWRALAAATFLTPAALLPSAEAAQLAVVVTPVADPILGNLAIPDTAPKQGMWSGVSNWPLNAILASLLPTGKVLSFGTAIGDPGVQNGRTFDIWDPTKGPVDGSHVSYQEPAFINSFCGTMAFQADGSVLVAGGIFDGGVDKGSAVLNPTATGVTSLGANLANDRYYSTMITLADGRKLIMGGSYPYQGGWADPQGSIDRGLMTGMTPEVYDGARWNSLFGANSRDAFGPDNSRWWYPRAWVAPSGKVFGISAERMWLLDPNGNGSVTAMPFKEPQRNAASATDAPNVGPVSTAVMYDTGKVLQVGGNGYDNGNGFLSSNRATIVDINGAQPVLSEAPPMSYGRAWANATVLPTGAVAVTGGSKFNDSAGDNTVLAAELWDPKANAWTVGASNTVYRGYHSSATLMQNGTILIAGGGAPGPVNNSNAEFYYPPYLFTTVNGKAALAPRPQIVSLSTNRLGHAQSMQIELTASNGLSQVVLVGLSQGTHSFNSNQRRVPVTFSQSGTLVTLQTPASPNLAPPGYYQIVAVDQNGVPSPGVIVALGANVAAPSGGVTVPTNPASVASSGGWTACAAEGGTCTVSNGPRTVRFGANGQYVTKSVTGAIACTNDAFGRDPIYGTVKVCEVGSPGATGTDTGTGTGATGSTGTGSTGSTGTGTGGAGTGGTGTGGTSGTGTGGTGTSPAGGSPLKAAHSGLCLATPSGNANDGAPVTQQVCTGAAEQSWRFNPVAGGYTITNNATGKCLDVSEVSKLNGARVWAWGCYGSANQIWTSRPQGNGVSYVSANSNLCLDVNGASMQPGGAAIQWACSGSANQIFATSATQGTTASVPPVPTVAIALESASNPGNFARRVNGDLLSAAPVVTPIDRLEASFKVVPGLGGQGVSLQSTREWNRYFAQSNFGIYLSPTAAIGSGQDASFMRGAALAQTCGCNTGSCVSYQSVRFPNLYMRVRLDGTLGLDTFTDTQAYRQQASFCERP